MSTQSRTRILLVSAITLVLLGTPSAEVSAAPITFTFSGDVTFVNSSVASAFSLSDDMTGSLTYDSALVDSNANANVGDYGPLSALSFSIGNDTFTFVNGSGSVYVENGISSDQLRFSAFVTGSQFAIPYGSHICIASWYLRRTLLCPENSNT